MTNEKYNGWTNYETWKVNLELVDHECLAEMLAEYEPCFDSFVDMVKQYCVEIAYLGAAEHSFAQSAVHAMLAPVNWYEIAEHIQAAYTEEEAA